MNETKNKKYKTCPTCLNAEKIENFTRCANSKDGRYYECKFCKQERAHK